MFKAYLNLLSTSLLFNSIPRAAWIGTAPRIVYQQRGDEGDSPGRSAEMSELAAESGRSISNSALEPSSSVPMRQERSGLKRCLVAAKHVTIEGRATHVLSRRGPDDAKDDLRLTQTYLERISSNCDFR